MPVAVPIMKANKPRKKMKMTSLRKKVSALIVAPTLMPRKIVTMFMSEF